jgi:hypothetical protein
MTWQMVFACFAGLILASLLVLPMMRSLQMASTADLQESLSQTLTREFRDPSYTLIFLVFFSCGYQLGFMTAHFPAFVTETCGPSRRAACWSAWVSPPPPPSEQWPSR